MLELAGHALEEPIEGRGGFQIELAQAELAFGPLYLCAGALAGDNCDTARLEWLDSIVVNALDPAAVEAGRLTGVTGPVLSAMYDFGITSLLTVQEPVVLAASEALGGNSVRVEGTASRDADSVSFQLAMPIRQGMDAEIGVSVVRVSNASDLAHGVTDDGSLLVRFDARPWVLDIDFDAVLADAAAAPGSTLELSPESQAQRALRSALLSGPRPSFEWRSVANGPTPSRNE